MAPNPLPRCIAASLALLALGGTAPRARQQAADLKPCPITSRAGQTTAAECGDLRVFENRVTKQGRKIPIHYMVIRADQQPAREALFMFAGGPGEGSTSMTGTANGWARPVRATMDVVLVDQRGTGQSHRLGCSLGSNTNPAEGFGQMYTRERVKACRAELEKDADLTQYTTDIAIQDVEDNRAMLGYSKIAVYGGSYGTRMAQTYMKRYPARTKSAVIDGVVPFDNAIPVRHAASAQQALDRVFASCAATPACKAEHPNLAADFQTLLKRLDAGPVKASVTPRGGTPSPVMINRNDFGYAVRGIMYNGNPTNTIAGLIGRAVASGDFSEFAQRYFDRQISFSQNLAYGLHWSIMCAEDVAYATDAEIKAGTENTFLGTYVFDEYTAACALWPRSKIASDFRTPAKVKVPTLLVSGHFDPVTPQQFADRIASSLPLAKQVVSPTTAHGSSSGCARAAVLHVITTGTLEGMPEGCK